MSGPESVCTVNNVCYSHSPVSAREGDKPAQNPKNQPPFEPDPGAVPNPSPPNPPVEVTPISFSGLQSTAAQFIEYSYMFEPKEDPSSLPFLSPFQEVTLRGNPDAAVPWTDPFLLREWEAFIQDQLGVEIKKDGTEKNYFYQDQLIMTRKDDEKAIAFKLYNPQGKVVQSATLNKPQKPEIIVSRGGKDKDGLDIFFVTVYGKKVEVHTAFPKGTTGKTQEGILKMIGEVLQEMPKSLLDPLLDGKDKEPPIRIVLSDQKTATELKLVRSPSFGGFNRSVNEVWLRLFPHWETGELTFNKALLAHELIGHAVDDFLVPDDKGKGITNRKYSAIADYYLWKLSNIFSPKELAEYAKLSRAYAKERDKRSPNKAKLKEKKDALAPYRQRIEKHFVEAYAVEGKNFMEQINEAREYYAHTVMYNIVAIHNPKDLDVVRWRYVRRDDFTKLITLHYLFEAYGVDKIGDIGRDEVYSAAAFQKMFGVDLSNMEGIRNEYLSAIRESRKDK